MTGVRVEGLVFGEGGIEVSEVGVEDTKERVQGDTIEILLGLVYASRSSIFLGGSKGKQRNFDF